MIAYHDDDCPAAFHVECGGLWRLHRVGLDRASMDAEAMPGGCTCEPTVDARQPTVDARQPTVDAPRHIDGRDIGIVDGVRLVAVLALAFAVSIPPAWLLFSALAAAPGWVHLGLLLAGAALVIYRAHRVERSQP